MATLSIKIAGTSYTLTQASLRSLVHTVTAGQPASLAGEIYTTAIPSTALAYGDLIELWVNSVRRFCGWLGPVTTGFDAQGSYVHIEARDILHRLRNTPLTKRIVSDVFSTTASGLDHYIYTLADTTTTEVRLFGGGFVPDEEAEGYYRWQYGSGSDPELARICAHASTAYSPGLDLGTTAGLSTKNQPEDVVNLDCLAALQRCTKYRPDAILWVDASGTTPALHCITRDNCTAVTLDLSARDRIRGWSLSAREDLRLLYLRWRLARTNRERTAAGDLVETQYTSVYEYGDDSAPADRRSELKFSLGAYSTDPTLGTPVSDFPSSAASDYWSACSPLHWEGECTLYPPASVDPYTYGLGQVHDFSGGETALATCHALVRAASYDHAAGTVALEYGPPDTLSPQDVLSGSASGAISATPPRDEPADPSAPGNGDLPAQVTGGLAGQYSILSTTGEVQVIEGTATLKGWDALHPSFTETPPRKWLNLVYSGSLTGRGDLYCDGTFEETNTLTASGTAIYNPVTDAITPVIGSWSGFYTASVNITSQCSPGDPGSVGVQFPFFAVSATSGYKRATQWEPYVTDQCPLVASQDVFPASWAWGSMCYGSSGRVNVSLLNEDTEQAAIARLGDTWADPVGTGEKKTFYEQRTTGFSFAVRRCRLHGYTWTASIYGLPVEISAPLYKYPYGGTRPAEPTATQVWQLNLVQTPYTTTGEHGLTLTKYHGVATLPDWELPIEQGYVIELGDMTISLL